jgi:hypothetical protein
LEAEKSKQGLVQDFNGYVKENRCLIVPFDLLTIEEWDQIKKCFKTTREEAILVSTA